jgi:hypothetical protein
MAPIETYQAKTINYDEKPTETCPHRVTLFWDVQKTLERILESRYQILDHFYFENDQAIIDQGDVYVVGETKEDASAIISYSESSNDLGEIIFDVIAPQEVLDELRKALASDEK